MNPRVLVPLAVLLAGCPDVSFLDFTRTAPQIRFQTPLQGDVFDEGTDVLFIVDVADDGKPEDLTLTWFSNRDGDLDVGGAIDESGQLSFVTSDLKIGTHTITVTVEDADGESSSVQTDIEVIDVRDRPQVYFVRPALGDIAGPDSDFDLVALISDDLDDPDQIVVQFRDEADGVLCEGKLVDVRGQAHCPARLSVGLHDLSVWAQDSDGNEDEAFAQLESIPGDEFDDDLDGFNEIQGDCDDARDTVFPGAPEICDGHDNDCDDDGTVDEGTLCYDDDEDGFAESEGDCDDSNPNFGPGAPDPWYVGGDTNCDGQNDFDQDGDGYAKGGTVDCDDLDPTVNAGATERCNGVDDNCNAQVDENVAYDWQIDDDYDGFGAIGSPVVGCNPPSDHNYVVQSPIRDCYDRNRYAYPGSPYQSSTSRGDGSFDYDCSNSEEFEYPTTVSYSCVVDNDPFNNGFDLALGVDYTPGWLVSRPACGRSAEWAGTCDWENVGGTVLNLWLKINGPGDVSTRVQRCH